MSAPYDIIIKVINRAEDSRYKGKSYRGDEFTVIIDLSVSSQGFFYYNYVEIPAGNFTTKSQAFRLNPFRH